MERWRPHFLVVCLTIVLSFTGALRTANDSLTDFRFQLWPRHATGQVVVVAINAPSIEKVGVWPWPRTVHAELLKKLRIAEATDVAFDVDFSSRSNPADDRALLDELQAFGGSTILPTFKQAIKDQNGALRVFVARPLPELTAQAWSAAVNVQPEPNGLVRRYALGEKIEDEFLPSMAALLAGRYDKAAQHFLIDYSIRAQLPRISVADILDDSADLRLLKGKKVIIGATAIELGDRFHVPIAGNISGVELQALAAETILQDRQLVATTSILSVAGLGLLTLGMLLVWGRFTPARTTLGLLVLALAIEGAAQLLQATAPLVVDTSMWLAGIAGYVLALCLNELDLRQLLANVAQKRFQSIAVALGDGVVCMDPNGLITFWNPSAQRIFGYSAAEISGRPFAALYDNRKNPDLAELLALCEISQQAIEIVGVRQNGDTFPLEVRVSSWDLNDCKHFGAIVRDISARKREEAHIRHLALHDALTGLANRAQIRDCLAQCMQRADGRNESVAVLLLDLDNFKEINDTLGHETGDRFLCDFAKQLQQCVGDDAHVARLGGDEFVVVIDGDEAETKAQAIVRSIEAIFGDSYTYIDGSGFLISASIGSAVHPRDASTIDELMANADLALYRAKKEKRTTHVPYDSTFKRDLEQRRKLEAELVRAVAENEFELFYQPQVRFRDGSLVGAEALIRWRHPTRGLVLPGEFLEILHASKLSNLVASWVLRSACEQGRRWQASGHAIRIGVNLSPSQFHAELPKTIERVLVQTGLAPRLLEIEFTEDILLKEDSRTIDVLQQIRNQGVRIAFDDFGTGFASLSHLRRFPMDCLKIDRSFASDLGIDRNNTAIATAIVELGNRLGLCTIAEGVEDQRCAEWLGKLGCTEGQGYHFGKPMSVGQMQEILETQSCDIWNTPASAA